MSESKDSVVSRNRADRRIFSVSEKHLRNLRKPTKTVVMRLEVCYNINCIWLRIFDEIITLSVAEYLEQSSRDR